MPAIKTRDVILSLHDARILYSLLKERLQETNISHKELPVFEQHCHFMISSSYKEWKFIYVGTRVVGHYYITATKYPHMAINEIGIQIFKKFQRQGIATAVLKKIISEAKGPLYANIALNNFISQKLFENAGFKCVQRTYKKEKE